jgi:hypothetical protein
MERSEPSTTSTFPTQCVEALHVDPVVIEKCWGQKLPKIMATYKNEMPLQRKEALLKRAELIDNLGLTSSN